MINKISNLKFDSMFETDLEITNDEFKDALKYPVGTVIKDANGMHIRTSKVDAGWTSYGGDSRLYRVYTAVICQDNGLNSGVPTDDPEIYSPANLLENTFASYAWSKIATGVYDFTFTGDASQNSVVFISNENAGTGDVAVVYGRSFTGNSIRITSSLINPLGTKTATDGLLYDCHIEIRVYP